MRQVRLKLATPLKDVTQSELQAARIAVEHLVPLREVGVAWDQEAPSSRVVVIQPYGVDVTRRVLRVIEDIGKIATELDRVPFTNRELLRK